MAVAIGIAAETPEIDVFALIFVALTLEIMAAIVAAIEAGTVVPALETALVAAALAVVDETLTTIGATPVPALSLAIVLKALPVVEATTIATPPVASLTLSIGAESLPIVRTTAVAATLAGVDEARPDAPALVLAAREALRGLIATELRVDGLRASVIGTRLRLAERLCGRALRSLVDAEMALGLLLRLATAEAAAFKLGLLLATAEAPAIELRHALRRTRGTTLRHESRARGRGLRTWRGCGRRRRGVATAALRVPLAVPVMMILRERG